MELTLNSAVVGLQPSGIRQFSALARSTPGAMMLTIGEPDLNTPENVKECVKTALDANDTHYPDNNGKIELRRAIAAFEAERNGLHYDPEEIIVTCGATEALFSALFTVLNPGDEVIIPTPAFGLYQSITEMCRGVAVNLPTEDNDFQIDPPGSPPPSRTRPRPSSSPLPTIPPAGSTPGRLWTPSMRS